ncbi:MAG TPA: hypothetical protein VMW45_03675 [Dehalococcoidia bacterium]|nr:hypothetical protein [Dehalococcoidia bacterium]
MAKLTPTNRDELLIRLDERTNNIWTLTEKQEEHLAKINNHLDDHSKRLTIAETQLAERTSSKVSKKAVAGYGGGTAVVVSTLVLAIGQIMGWW